ncbi:MAG: 3-hydroxyacyl-ACP dehydratase [Firmicutes bacterium]|nr:3-hydroxyacyl-ACP dehydratase [Bacillota bacterium]
MKLKNNQVENRANVEEPKSRAEKRREIVLKNMVMNANKMLRKLGAQNHFPLYGMTYFLNLLKKTYSDMEDIGRGTDCMTFGLFCVMIPEELIYAAGGIPVKLCGGSHVSAAIGDEVMPRDACPLVKAVMGCASMELLPVGNNCHSFIVPSTCDCKRKMAGELESFKEVYPLHVPSTRELDEQKEYFLEELYGLLRHLEKATGNKVSSEKLLNSTHEIAKAQKEVYRLYTIQKNNPPVMHGSQVITVLNTYAFDHVKRWTSALALLNDELEERIKNQQFAAKAKMPRIMIVGSPVIFPNIKIPILIEESGGIVAIDETCAGFRWLYDPVVVRESNLEELMRSLANRYMLPCTCPTFVNNEQRIFKLQQMIEEFQIDGLVYHMLRGCLAYDSEYAMVEQAMEQLGIPIVKVETDYNEEDIEQLRIRFEAFIELIKHSKYSRV